MLDNQEKCFTEVKRYHELIFWVVATVMLFIFLGHNALWGSENRWAEITREMILTGDWLHPAINWQIYFDKPQLSYWFIAPFMMLFGVNELVTRIPSALAALVVLYSIMSLGKSLFDRRTALLAGWITLGCYSFLFWGRMAAADMANVAAITLAVAFFYKVEKKAGFFSYLIFYLIIFLGALTKGLPAIVMPVAFLAPHLLTAGRWKRHFNFANFAALIIGCAVYLAPFLAAAYITPESPLHYPPNNALSGLELVWRENIIRVFNAFDHKDPFYSYFYNLPRTLLPWAIIIIPAVISMLIRYKKALPERTRELLFGIIMVYLLYSLSTSRRWYYILPLVPFCALLGAVAIEDGLKCRDKWCIYTIKALRYTIITAACIAIAAVISKPIWEKLLFLSPPMLAYLSLPVGGILAAIVLFAESHPEKPIVKWSGLPEEFAGTLIAGNILIATVFCCILPSFTVFRTTKPYFVKVSEELASMDSKNIIFFGKGESNASFLYYSGRTTPLSITSTGEKSIEEFREFIKERAGQRIAIICQNHPKRELKHLAEAVKENNLQIDVSKPDMLEPKINNFGSSKKLWATWIITLPAAETKTDIRK